MGRLRDKWFKTDDEVEAEREQEQTQEYVRMVQNGLPLIHELKRMLAQKAKTTRWSPEMTQEQAASNLIAQTIYAEIQETLDRMVARAQESVDG